MNSKHFYQLYEEPKVSVSRVVTYVNRPLFEEEGKTPTSIPHYYLSMRRVNCCKRIARRFRWSIIDVIRDLDCTGNGRNGLMKLVKLAKNTRW